MTVTMKIDKFIEKFSAVAKDFEISSGFLRHRTTKCCPILAVAGYDVPYNEMAVGVGQKIGLSQEDINLIIRAADDSAVDAKSVVIRQRFLDSVKMGETR